MEKQNTKERGEERREGARKERIKLRHIGVKLLGTNGKQKLQGLQEVKKAQEEKMN